MMNKEILKCDDVEIRKRKFHYCEYLFHIKCTVVDNSLIFKFLLAKKVINDFQK